MSIQQTQGFCKTCNENVLATRQGRNHILHLLLSLVTGGLWLIVWIMLAITSKPWLCSKCGTKV